MYLVIKDAWTSEDCFMKGEYVYDIPRSFRGNVGEHFRWVERDEGPDY